MTGSVLAQWCSAVAEAYNVRSKDEGGDNKVFYVKPLE